MGDDDSHFQIPDTRTEQGRRALRSHLLSSSSSSDPEGDHLDFISRMPKIELHVHIEGTLTPELRWKLAQRNGIGIRFKKEAVEELKSLDQVRQAYRSVISSAQLPSYHAEGRIPPPTFFEAYYSGCDVLLTQQDFSDLGYDYLRRAATEMKNVRYCEVFFDPQSHTSRGVAWEDIMSGLRDAKVRAEEEFGIKSNYIPCFLRDRPVESAWEHYTHIVSHYKEMIIGFGLDSNETDHPPHLFDEIFSRAREDGFRITAHCDVGQRDTYGNIRHVVSVLGGGGDEGTRGADRLDHGLNAADKEELVDLLVDNNSPEKGKEVGMTLCPWAYLRRWGYEDCARRMRVFLPGGGDDDDYDEDAKKKGGKGGKGKVRVCISSDSPAYQDDCWVLESLLLARKMCDLSKRDMLEMMKGSVEMSWAAEEVKEELLRELEEFGRANLP